MSVITDVPPAGQKIQKVRGRAIQGQANGLTDATGGTGVGVGTTTRR
ncbi:hypothetical protein [Actinophytocola sp.]